MKPSSPKASAGSCSPLLKVGRDENRLTEGREGSGSRVERVHEEPSPSSNRTCGFPAYGFRESVLHEAFTSKAGPNDGGTGKGSGRQVFSKAVDCAVEGDAQLGAEHTN